MRAPPLREQRQGAAGASGEGGDPGRGPLTLAVIDRETGFTRPLLNRLEARGWRARLLDDAPSADELADLNVAAVVVDVAGLGAGGLEFLELVCRGLPGLGVVVCTGPSSVAQRVHALRLGADDWITKPCHPEELIARVGAVVRRRKLAAGAIDPRPELAGELEIRPDRFEAYVAGRALDLTRREFELLLLLAEAKGRVLQREEIYQRVWGYVMARGDRSVDVFVRKLRTKLERASPGWRYIHTHFGVGYRFEPESDETGPEAPGAAGAAAGEAEPSGARRAPALSS